MKISIYSHEFIKSSLITIKRGTKNYDKVKCSICGLEGIRYGLSDMVSVKRDKKCIKDTCKQVMIIGDYVCAEFGFKKGEIYNKAMCPKGKEQYNNDVWVYSEERKEPVRLLPGEYRAIV